MVFNKQHGLPLPLQGFQISAILFMPFRFPVVSGKEYGECRTAAGSADNMNPAFMLRDNAVHDCKAKAGAGARRLGGEKRLEYVIQGLRIHARAGIRHCQLDECAGAGLGHEAAVSLQQQGVFRTYCYGAALGHGIARIDDKIHNHLL